MGSNYHCNLHRVTCGVGEVTEDEQCSLLRQCPSHREVPQLRADVLYSGALSHTHTHTNITQISFFSAGEEQSHNLIPPKTVEDAANQTTSRRKEDPILSEGWIFFTCI